MDHCIAAAIDIPVSLIGAFFIMYVAGFSINVLTLLAIVLATGLVVDNRILVTENIFKKMEQGMNERKAALEGSKEIYFAVIASRSPWRSFFCRSFSCKVLLAGYFANSGWFWPAPF